MLIAHWYSLIKTGRIPNVRHLHSSRDPTTLFEDGKLKECWGLVHVMGVTQNMPVIFLDWVNSGAPWRSRLWIGVDPVNLIGWMEWI